MHELLSRKGEKDVDNVVDLCRNSSVDRVIKTGCGERRKKRKNPTGVFGHTSPQTVVKRSTNGVTKIGSDVKTTSTVENMTTDPLTRTSPGRPSFIFLIPIPNNTSSIRNTRGLSVCVRTCVNVDGRPAVT